MGCCVLQGIYTEMKFEKPSRIQALTLPMILTPPHRSLIAQVIFMQQTLHCFSTSRNLLTMAGCI